MNKNVLSTFKQTVEDLNNYREIVGIDMSYDETKELSRQQEETKTIFIFFKMIDVKKHDNETNFFRDEEKNYNAYLKKHLLKLLIGCLSCS